jgi:hypothetical protein
MPVGSKYGRRFKLRGASSSPAGRTSRRRRRLTDPGPKNIAPVMDSEKRDSVTTHEPALEREKVDQEPSLIFNRGRLDRA